MQGRYRNPIEVVLQGAQLAYLPLGANCYLVPLEADKEPVQVVVQATENWVNLRTLDLLPQAVAATPEQLAAVLRLQGELPLARFHHDPATGRLEVVADLVAKTISLAPLRAGLAAVLALAARGRTALAGSVPSELARGAASAGEITLVWEELPGTPGQLPPPPIPPA